MFLHSVHLLAQPQPDIVVPTSGKWSERMALSVLKRSPEAWANDETGLSPHFWSRAGLGNDPYRPGTFEYYIGEATRVDDSHGVGAFILAALALGR